MPKSWFYFFTIEKCAGKNIFIDKMLIIPKPVSTAHYEPLYPKPQLKSTKLNYFTRLPSRNSFL